MKKTFLVTGIIFVSCIITTIARAQRFEPTYRANPWPDDYSHLTDYSHYESWGTYNVHDPSCIEADGWYYMFSTDAILHDKPSRARELGIKTGYIQVRRSRDLVNWEFMGWAFDEIPAEARQWVQSHNNGRGASNIWAPYIIKADDKFRLYYSVSAFGRPTSYIGMAEATTPMGPWVLKGAVVRSCDETPVNAIDPTVIVDRDGRWFMHYGSYFGGIYCLELDAATGLPLTAGDLGHVVARRANYKVDNLEAPEIFYIPGHGQYYLFGSYEPLMTTYNVRVGRSDKADGPFIDFHGKEMQDTTDNLPILTAPYRWGGHDGWGGTGHCGVFSAPEGNLFMVHQGRLSPLHDMMVMHLRSMFITEDGWPVVSPERYAGTPERHFETGDMAGVWEIMRLRDPKSNRKLMAGQVLWGEGKLRPEEVAVSRVCALYPDGYLTHADTTGEWQLDEDRQHVTLRIGDEQLTGLILHHGHDWERQIDTMLLTGLDSNGNTVWAKRIK